MPEVTATVHKDGLHPMEAFKAHHVSQELGMSLDDLLAEGGIRKLSRHPQGRYALWAAIKRVKDMYQDDLLPKSRYGSRDRKAAPTVAEGKRILEFVRKWRHKRFCTCRYIKHDPKLKDLRRTTDRLLNEHGSNASARGKVLEISVRLWAGRAGPNARGTAPLARGAVSTLFVL